MSYDDQKARQIWQTVQSVPYGKVANYGLIADLAGLPGRARMVGSIMQKAPEQMELPWYRIIRSNGHIAFPAGSRMLNLQTELLREEGVHVTGNRINLKQYLWKPDLAELLDLGF